MPPSVSSVRLTEQRRRRARCVLRHLFMPCLVPCIGMGACLDTGHRWQSLLARSVVPAGPSESSHDNTHASLTCTARCTLQSSLLPTLLLQLLRKGLDGLIFLSRIAQDAIVYNLALFITEASFIIRRAAAFAMRSRVITTRPTLSSVALQ